MSTLRSLCYLIATMTCVLPFVGCGGGIAPPPVDSAGATAAAMKEMDKDGDGMLSEEEVTACPALLDSMSEYDLDGDKQLTAEELEARFRLMYDGTVGLISADCKVTWNKKPLEGAEVRYVPEAFLGGSTKTASGVTDKFGFARLVIPDDQLPEDQRGLYKMQVGLYRVQITHPEHDIPAKYNTDSTLGFELNPANHEEPHGVFHLLK